ncbi:thioredoxin domain-containing protein [Aggregatimonas sangjinii]|uniref:Thioredoxin domain-containing protein n=1 Tax=Aggregatimonas sangjinii TaxID=2583587 RepID=A0A5B7SWP8_9FLAO|nr:thioredoxin domain-containing protein [Aggregatimonas sangjinii]QCX01180.1 thioredoxin domain-containing protein [Aggregatimonas sangjinii]
MSHTFTNDLIHETSPYLLQHAHNPVNWEAWQPEVLQRAKKENKLLLISIGYAACHWCHVMEHECFEDEAVAQVMNTHFINIKIDREERPDIDHIYMDALQLMTGSGGWPLNIVALPDGRPFWGATYVQKDNWTKVLEQLSKTYQEEPIKVREYAENLANGIKQVNLIPAKPDNTILTTKQLEKVIADWSKYFDTFLGGYKRAPKFMMPVNLNFLLHYSTATNDESVLEYVNTTLTRMAWGGIFDHVAGGFSRYSVDTKWHVPHFEKMLYDNGQLVSLYSQAYAATGNELYKETAERTIDFVQNELMNENNGFYSSLDADSLTPEGKLEEGAYYVWKEEALKKLLGTDFPVFKDYFNINAYGHWEHGNYVLIRDASLNALAMKHDLKPEELQKIINRNLALLATEREKRERPRLDDKILTSWNGLMLKGLTDAYRYFRDKKYVELAIKNALFIEKNMLREDGFLFHNHKNGKSSINGYLEDYAAVIDAYIGLYEVCADAKWLHLAKKLTDYCLENFLDKASGLFFFTSKRDDFIIRRTLETTDNVVPASNSIMAKNLFKLSRFYFEKGYEEQAREMLRHMQENLTENGQNHANWLQLNLLLTQEFYEVAVVGDAYAGKLSDLQKTYLPNVIMAGAGEDSKIPLLSNRFINDRTLLYVCQHGSCKLPVSETSEALDSVSISTGH